MEKINTEQEMFRSDQLNKPLNNFWNRVRVRALVSNLIRNHPAQLYFNQRLKEKQYLHLGCGGNIFKDFVNADYGWNSGVDLCWNFLYPFPFADNSFKGIFTEHVLEHFTWKELLKIVLPETFRLLKPGGVIRVCVPDAEKAINIYNEAREAGETSTVITEHYSGGERLPLTPMLLVNDRFHRLYEPPGCGHKIGLDYQTMEYFLHSVGFVEVKRESYMNGRDPILLVDLQRRESESLYVEACKPENRIDVHRC